MMTAFRYSPADRAFKALLALIVLLGMIYVGMRWTPSSYGLVLAQIGEPAAGLSYGTPRPIRSDEWAVATPLLQAAVRNGFERYNKTSLYQEDLRFNFGLPIADWAMAFKPTMWGYYLLAPATAYSLHWYLLFAFFILGYSLLIRRMGFRFAHATLTSFGLYFTGFVQFWWNEKGSEFAIFPLVILVLILDCPRWMRLVLFYWLCTSWLLTNFYPPIQISLAFVGVAITVAYGRDWLQPKRLAALLSVAALSAFTAAWYLRDYLLATATTLYPGHRVVGGGTVTVKGWITQFFPYLLFDWRYDDLTGTNICEGATLALGFALMVVVFLRYERLAKRLSIPSAERRQLAVLTSALLAMTAWMLVPLRPWVGMPLLWNNVQPVRMQFAAGLLFVLVAGSAARIGGLVVTSRRLAVYAAIVLVGWLGLKDVNLQNALITSNDLVLLPATLICIAVLRRHLETMGALLAASTLSGVIALVGFNPLQSAAPIFAPTTSPVLRELDEESLESNGLLAVPGFAGATLNGLGYRSVSHVTAVPALAFWRRKYPSMPESEFNLIFNRYAHLTLQKRESPALLSTDSIAIPLKDALPTGYVDLDSPEIADSQQAIWITQGQQISGQFKSPRTGSIEGLSIEIGNGQNTSDGTLTLEVCDKLRCEQGARDVSHTIDNHAMTIKLQRQLKVGTGDPVELHLSLAGGTRGVALWTFTPADLMKAKVTLDTNSGLRVPHVRLHYATGALEP